jgi:hypothetical protein
MRRKVLVAIGLATITAAAVAAFAAARPARVTLSPLPAGWARGGSASSPGSQVAADTSCVANSVLLFSARGSGDVYGGSLAHNKIGAWTQGAGIELIHEGWNVRDLQAIYPAPPVPSFTELAKATLVGGTAAAALIVKDYRDAATHSWEAVKSELDAAHNRCPTRPIFLAGYSQGAILLRYVVPHLSPSLLAKIESVDLIADPTEQRVVDGGLQHPASLDARLTNRGIDTFAGEILNAGSFQQTAYPSSLQRRVFQYCVEGDFVCDLSRANLSPSNALNEGGIHASYAFEATGIAAGKRLGAYETAASPPAVPLPPHPAPGPIVANGKPTVASARFGTAARRTSVGDTLTCAGPSFSPVPSATYYIWYRSTFNVPSRSWSGTYIGTASVRATYGVTTADRSTLVGGSPNVAIWCVAEAQATASSAWTYAFSTPVFVQP